MFSLYINLLFIEHNLFKPISGFLGNKLRNLFSLKSFAEIWLSVNTVIDTN